MAKLSVLACFLLLLAVSSATSREGDQYERRHERRHQRRQDRRQQEQRFDDLEPRRPQEIFRSEGGRIEEWQPEDYPALCAAEVGARRVTLNQNGFAIPCYKDSPMIKVITRGRCRAGIIKPFTDKVVGRNTVFNLEKGDIIALPRGVASWFYNEDSEETEILEIADTTESPNCGRFRAFILGGGRQENKQSVIHGFSKDMMAHAWDVEEQTIERMLEGRKGAAIIRVDEEKMRLPRQSSRNTLFADFVYHLKDSAPDVNVRNAGQLHFLNSLKLPILRNLNMGAMCVKLEQGALAAPNWLHNAHNVMYVEGGRGRVQVVRENGEQALDTEVERGQLVIIPANFPSVKRAEDDREGFRYFGILTNDMPVRSSLAGRNSVYQGMPRGVVSASFQVEERVLRELEETRRDEDYLFPPRRQSRHGSRWGHDSSFVETLVETLVV